MNNNTWSNEDVLKIMNSSSYSTQKSNPEHIINNNNNNTSASSAFITKTLASGTVNLSSLSNPKINNWIFNSPTPSPPPSSNLPFSLQMSPNLNFQLEQTTTSAHSTAQTQQTAPKFSKITKSKHKNARPYLSFNIQNDYELIRQKAADNYNQNSQRLIKLMSYYESKLNRNSDDPTCCGITYKQLEEEEKECIEKRLHRIKKCAQRIEKLIDPPPQPVHHPRKFFTQL